ncbi:MAG: hypothetical protein V1733_06680 [bacterium]
MKRLTLIYLILLLSLSPAHAQTALDALRYSRIFYNGTARFMGTGGAFGAVGADFSTAATNPAGIALYRSSEITLSPSFIVEYNTSEYNGTSGRDSEVNFAMSNFGFIYTLFTGKANRTGGLRSINIGFGMNRQNDFNERVFIQGPNHTSSILNYFTDILNTPPVTKPNMVRYDYPFDIGLAYDCGLIFYDSIQKKYFFDMPDGGVYQEKVIRTWGSINEFDISFGGNIADKLYVGLTVGIPSIRYFSESNYREEDTGDSIPYFQSLSYSYNYQTNGTGVNFKLGLIYRPANWIRLGAAIHTPTWYPNVYDYYNSYMSATFDSVLNYPTQVSPEGFYNYQMMTPFRAIGSLALFVGKYGFISGEYEYVAYNQARYRAPGDDFEDVNTVIINDYNSPITFRVGTEWRILMLRIRGGFGYYGSPDKLGDIGPRYVISGGFGIHLKRFFANVAYQWARSDGKYYLYDPAMVNPADLTLHAHSITTTFGIKF